ncbi:AAA family ATPase [Polyangium jinanense]|uniref:AAA family ATPase n=1 Tax=Polyangium jinanense TaxID=2829994 RepID=A0A9X3X2F5_9BACT|nr:AAA family ATPase [Polyangium jinanense]MDC3954670.1 AAA family ATPase [Polyangium jinanense]MDC3980973.1 AAA family ATPase [Polyangium jinanense]
MSRRETWLAVIDRFDPELSPRNPAWRAPRSRSPAGTICEWLDIPRGIPRLLVTGTIGTGKTTELQRIAEERAGKEFVVFVDLERHCSEVVHDAQAIERVSPWEVCFLMGVALLRAAEERLAYVLPEEHRKDLEKRWAALAGRTNADAPPQIDIASLAKSMVVLASSTATGAPAAVGTGLQLLKAGAEAVKWTAPFGRTQKALADQESDVQALLDCVNTLIGLVQQRGSRVLFIIDGLDRIRDFNRAKALFLDSVLISQLACPMVICGPFALRHHPATAAIRGFHDVPSLVNEPVLRKDKPRELGPGVAFFRELFARRVADLPGGPDLFTPQQIDKLAYHSGGRAREFVKFVFRIAGLAHREDLAQATDELVERVLEEARRQRETGLNKGHIRTLEEIAKDPDHRLPEGNLAQELLTYGTLLPYPNDSEWYFPHPLLLRHMIKL